MQWLPEVLRRVRAVPIPKEIILVDDCSSDGTRDLLRALEGDDDVRVLYQPVNQGKGAALRDGIREAIRSGAAIIVTVDADGQHPPEEIPRLIRPIAERQADIVLGARQRNGGMPVSRRFTNWLSASLATRIGGQKVLDAQTGFRAFTREVAERVQPAGNRYEYEANFLLDALRAGFRVTSVEVPTIYGGAARSHFRAWSDTWRMARAFAKQLRR